MAHASFVATQSSVRAEHARWHDQRSSTDLTVQRSAARSKDDATQTPTARQKLFTHAATRSFTALGTPCGHTSEFGELVGGSGGLLASMQRELAIFYGFTDFRGKPAGWGRDSRGSPNQVTAGKLMVNKLLKFFFACGGQPALLSRNCAHPPRPACTVA